MRPLAGSLLAATLAVLGACGAARGDVFLLSNGGRVEGELLNPDQSPRETYTVRTVHGVQLTLSPDQVDEVRRQRPEKVEYEAARHTYPDTIEGQWKLAEWCRERNLLSERERHLRRILELDPDHEQARRGLGYSRTGEKWMTQDERMLAEGYRRYKGRWRLPQEIELMEKDREKEAVEGQWRQRLGLWRNWLGTDKHRLARENIQAIDDPNAVKALAYALKEDSRDQARLLYAEALARIGTSGAHQILAIEAMQDPIEEVRLTCLDYLRDKEDPAVVEYFISALRSSKIADINQAARALEHLGATTAVGALIEVLRTTHKYKVTTGNPGQTSASFGSNGGSGLSTGTSTRIITRESLNRDVLDALVELTGGANFGFDEGRWKAWFASQMTRSDLDTRRD